jgi:hypothetical protein
MESRTWRGILSAKRIPNQGADAVTGESQSESQASRMAICEGSQHHRPSNISIHVYDRHRSALFSVQARRANHWIVLLSTNLAGLNTRPLKESLGKTDVLDVRSSFTFQVAPRGQGRRVAIPKLEISDDR